MKIDFLTREDLPKKDIEALWDEGVNMDDWDYVLIVPAEALEIDAALGNNEEPDKKYYAPKTYDLERLLTGVCDNRWYVVNFRGERVGVGVAYHA